MFMTYSHLNSTRDDGGGGGKVVSTSKHVIYSLVDQPAYYIARITFSTNEKNPGCSFFFSLSFLSPKGISSRVKQHWAYWCIVPERVLYFI